MLIKPFVKALFYCRYIAPLVQEITDKFERNINPFLQTQCVAKLQIFASGLDNGQGR